MRNLRIALVAALVMFLAAAAVPAAPGGGDVLAQDDTADVGEPWVIIDDLPLFHPASLLFTQTFTGTATDAASPIASVEYQIDGGVWIPAQPVDGAFDSLTEKYTFTTSALSEGWHQLEVRASDGAGNVGTASFNPPEGFLVTTAELGSLICGTSSYVDGTFVWTDYAYDDHGANVVPKALPFEFSLPNGDAEYPEWAAPGNAADLIQLQIGLQYDGLHLRAVLQTLTNVTFTLPVEVPNGNGEEMRDVITRIPVLGVAFDTDANPTTGATRLPGGQWPADGLLGVERLVVVSTHVIEVKDDDGRVVRYDVENVGELWGYTGGWPWWWLETWSIIDTFDATVDPDSNVMETVVPKDLLDPREETWRAFGVLGIRNADGGSWLDGSEEIYDLAFVGGEIPENWQDQKQSAILAGTRYAPGEYEQVWPTGASQAAAVIDFAKVSAGETELADGTSPGFHTYLYHSRLDLGEGIIEEASPLGPWFANNLYLGPYQPYLVWIPPEDIALDDPPPMLVFMHGADFNHCFALDWFGEDAGRTRPRPAFFDPYYGPGRMMPPAVVVSPLGRGERSFYTGIAEQDVLDAVDDAMARLGVDPNRVILSGGSMGGFGTMGIGTRYPDRWAMIAPSLGTGRQADDDPERILRENLLNLPVLMINGELDDLAVGALLDADLLDDLGYDYRSYIMLDKGHYGAPAVSECLYANLCNTSRRTVNPARVVYSVDPATFQVDESTGLDLQYDSAYWVSGITSSNGYATVDVTSLAIADRERIATELEDTGDGTTDMCGNVLPEEYQGIEWTLQGLELVPGELQPTSNVLNATLTNVGTVAFDLVRAGIATGEESTITVTTNSTVDVTLKGLHRNAGIVEGGELLAAADSEGQATAEQLTAGVHELTVIHATFEISEPTDSPFVSPDEIRTWTKDEHDFTVSVEVTNTSIVPGTYDVVVQVEGVGPWYEGLIDWYFAPSSLVKVSRSDVQRADVFVEAGASQTVSLTVTQEQPATYRVAVSPFEASGLVVFPKEPEEGEAVTISVGVTNTGIGAWTDKVVLKLDGTEIDSQVVTLKEGASESVVFELIQEKSGEYTIEVGELDGEFIIKTSGPTINAVLGGLFVVLVIAGVVILVRRTRAAA